ncbi:UNVERIFIED_CONTAM: hypothetical protein FKN15_017526 [Acipenser sinensis]
MQHNKTVHKPSEPQDMDLEHAIDNQTWLLTCLTVLMERNTTRLKEEAERSLLVVMEEEENLRRKVQEQKRQLRLRQKEKELDSLLDLQIAALTPLAAAAEKFKQEYKTFARALDTTRHELPVKNIHIEGDRQAFLDKAAVCLKETEKLLSELNPAAAEESDRACDLLKAVKDTTRSVDEELGSSWKPRRGTVRVDEEGAAPMGTCAGMCSERERLERQRQKRLHRFEILPGTERDRLPSADPGRAVKEYSRPAAGKDSTCPSELRPPAVLLKTVCYLIDEIASGQTRAPWTEVYGFVFDRLRSARQDLTIQRVSGRPCVAVLERTLRFLIYASYRLCQEPLRCFDPKINDTHVQECFSWLLGCYQEGIHDNEPEVQALVLLYNLGSLHALHHTLQLPEPVRSSGPVRLAASVSRAYLEGNLVRFFRLLRSLPFLQSCAMHRHLPRCRQEMLLFYSHGYSSRNCRYPLPLLAELLALEGPGEAAELCREHGITVGGDTVAFLKTAFRYPPALISRHSYELVDRKQGDRSIADVIHGYS